LHLAKTTVERCHLGFDEGGREPSNRERGF
jgi:hypothetical protein